MMRPRFPVEYYNPLLLHVFELDRRRARGKYTREYSHTVVIVQPKEDICQRPRIARSILLLDEKNMTLNVH
jgi:hypothetical protein